MAMDSFYGGRQGASFIIVYHFDAIEINDQNAYKYKEVAVASDNTNIYLSLDGTNFIYKDGNNYKNYNWKGLILDGNNDEPVVARKIPEGTSIQLNVPKEEAEGMVECFSQGGATVGKVNYGEYVIIDTPNKKDPDNGKVYRRGMNFDGVLAGAEYIGQIVGPQGESPEIAVAHFNEISQGVEIELDVSGEDLVPGYDSEEDIYKDGITYKYVNIKDEFGNVIGVKVGFQIPYLMVDFEAESLDPYAEAVIGKDPAFVEDGKWIHPFYQKWQIKVPRGIHGIDSTDIEIIPTKTRPFSEQAEESKKVLAYEDKECTLPAFVYPPDGGGHLYLNDYELAPDLGTSETPEDFMGVSEINGNKWAKCFYENNRIVYVKQEDCYCYIIKYKQTDYIDSSQGEATYIPIGEKEDIKKVELSENGYLTIYYTSSKNKETLNQRINWLTNIAINTNQGESSNKEGDGDQKVHVTYNNGDTAIIGNPLNYIIDTVVSKGNSALGIPYSHLLVYYSDPDKREREGESYAYYSPKLGASVTGWVDLGDVHGDPGSFLILKKVSSWDELHEDEDPNKRWLPPEELYPADDKHAGWGVTLELSGQNPQVLYYDYKTELWYSIGSLNASTIDPAHVLISSKEIAGTHNPDPSDEHYSSQLNINGFWFGQSAIKTAY